VGLVDLDEPLFGDDDGNLLDDDGGRLDLLEDGDVVLHRVRPLHLLKSGAKDGTDHGDGDRNFEVDHFVGVVSHVVQGLAVAKARRDVAVAVAFGHVGLVDRGMVARKVASFVVARKVASFVVAEVSGGPQHGAGKEEQGEGIHVVVRVAVG